MILYLVYAWAVFVAVCAYRLWLEVNRTQIDGWLWRARHAIRQGQPKLACEAMLAALWLMGAE